MKTLKLLGLGLLLCSGLKAQESKFLFYPDQSEWKSSYSVHYGVYDDYRYEAYWPLVSSFPHRTGLVNYSLLIRYGNLPSRFNINGDPVADFGLADSYSDWFISNSLTSSFRPMAYSFGYRFQLKPWVSVSTKLSYLDFGLNFQSNFTGVEQEGGTTESMEILKSFYQYRFKAVANTYQIRLQSPYLWRKIGCFIQAGLGVQFNFDASLEEQNEYQRFDYATGTETKGFNSYRFESTTKRSLDPIASPLEFGVSLYLMRNVRLEGFYRVENNFGSAEMAPTNNTIVGFNLVVNAAVLR